MDLYLTDFLDALQCAVRGEKLNWNDSRGKDFWRKYYQEGQKHGILPLIVHAVWDSSSLAASPDFKRMLGNRARTLTYFQAQKTADFILLYLFLISRGLKPVILKGIICRNLYPVPDQRASTDEDLLVDPAEFPDYHKALLDFGLTLIDPDEDIEKAHEIAYSDCNNNLYIEVHKTLFPQMSEAYGNMNVPFENVLNRITEITINGVCCATLAPTDHFLYLLCHAYKHFLHSGVGIRQVADMALFSNAYGDSIDWDHVYSVCQSIHIEVFAAALLQIACRHLTMKAIPIAFTKIDIDERPLLEDIMTGGLYGVADINRAHSSNMTLHAVASYAQGRSRSGVWRSLFPGKKYLKNHFSYAKNYPALLPVAWMQRIIKYLKHDKNSSVNPAKSIKIGNSRIQLLKQYGIIK
mgnify:CR=1 FL=1